MDFTDEENIKEPIKFKDYTSCSNIRARPMSLGEYNKLQGWVIHEDQNPEEKGFLIAREDNSYTWEPNDIFLDTHEAQKNNELFFGEAISLLKQGHCVARNGWNGKGMYLALQAGSTIPVENARGGAALAMANEGFDKIEICPHIDMRSADGKCVVGWLASQTDMLAEDWCIVSGTT